MKILDIPKIDDARAGLGSNRLKEGCPAIIKFLKNPNFADRQNEPDIVSGVFKWSYKPAQSTPIDFLERKNGTVDLITPSELRYIIDCLKKRIIYLFLI